MKMQWKSVYSGGLRFFGIDAMRQVRELVSGDDQYTWSYPAWPCEWIDVYPRTVDAQNLLLEIVEMGGWGE